MATGTRRLNHRWVGYGAALWALVFALLHAAWAAGWYVGLPEAQARVGFQQTWFRTYNLVAAGMCALAIPVALALVQAWGHNLSRRLRGVLAWGATGLLLLRSSAGVTQVAYQILTGTYIPASTDLYELWFCLGAALFGVSLWHFQRSS